jgi:hypothetical protein
MQVSLVVILVWLISINDVNTKNIGSTICLQYDDADDEINEENEILLTATVQ